MHPAPAFSALGYGPHSNRQRRPSCSCTNAPIEDKPTRMHSTRAWHCALPSLPALIAVACAAVTGVVSESAFAHGFAGKRLFPATLATDDPFVADELSLPTISRRRSGASGDSPPMLETDTSLDFTKRITPALGLGLGATWIRQHPEGAGAISGFDNLAANLKYQFYENDERGDADRVLWYTFGPAAQLRHKVEAAFLQALIPR